MKAVKEEARTGDPRRNFKLLAHTNVFGVGAIMCSLANCELLYDSSLDFVNGARSIKGENISWTLKWLIKRCVSFEPEDRHTFAQLRLIIQEKIEALAEGDSMFGYVEAARSGVQQRGTAFELLDFNQSGYKLGLALWEAG